MGNCQSENSHKTKNEHQRAKAEKAAQQETKKNGVSKAENQALIDAHDGATHSKAANEKRQVDSKIETETAKVKAREQAKKDEQGAIVENKENEAEKAERKVEQAVVPPAATANTAPPAANTPPATAAVPTTAAPPAV